jgi:hypothetical protein
MANFSRAYHSAVQRMILNRMRYDRDRYRIVNDYIEHRERALRRAHLASVEKLDEAHRMANQRGDFLLEMIERELSAELDAIMYADMMATNTVTVEDLLENFPLRASKAAGPPSPFSDSPDFLKTFGNLEL